MTFGLQLYGPIACRQMDFAPLIRGVKRLGYGLVEPCVDLDGSKNNHAFWPMTQIREKFVIIKEAGLEVLSCHVAAENLLRSLPELLRLVDEFGVKQIMTGTGDTDEAFLKETAALYTQIADELASHGAELLIHNGKPDIACKVHGKTAYEYLTDLCEGKVFMQFDTGWCARGGEDPMTFILRNENRIKSFHYKDFVMSNPADTDVCIGDGTLDNPAFMKWALSKGIPQYVDADTYTSVLDDAEKSLHYLESLI